MDTFTNFIIRMNEFYENIFCHKSIKFEITIRNLNIDPNKYILTTNLYMHCEWNNV